MIIMEFLMSLLANAGHNLTQKAILHVDTPTVCPSYIHTKHELCSDLECTEPVLLHEISHQVPKYMCRANQTQVNISCLTEDCIHTASRILKNMDETVNPCDDFYQFICGGFHKSERNENQEDQVSYLTNSYHSIQYQINNLLEEPIGPRDRPFVSKPKILYRACMNKDQILREGFTNLIKVLNKFGGWPVKLGNRWDESKFDWLQFIYRCREIGFSLSYIMTHDYLNYPTLINSRYFHITIPSFELDKEILARGFNDTNVKDLYANMVVFARAFGVNTPNYKQELKDALEFQIELAKLATSPHQKLDAATIFELDYTYPNISWLDHINKLTMPNFVFYPTMPVVVHHDYLSNVLNLLNKTSKRVIANYCIWRVIRDSVIYMPMHWIFNERRQQCLTHTVENMPVAVAAMYLTRYYSQATRDAQIELIGSIKKEFRLQLDTLNWLTRVAVKKLLDIFDNLDLRLAYPYDLFEDGQLADLYRGLQMSQDNFFLSGLNNTIFETDNLIAFPWESFNQTGCKPRFRDTNILAPTAFYFMCTGNNIVDISFSMIQGLMFSTNRPAYLNYGAVGLLVAHELFHMYNRIFSDRLYTPATMAEFNARKLCLVRLYDNFVIKGWRVRPLQTEAENLSDFNGYIVAYKAYETWLKNNRQEQGLPGLEKYTPKQLFWMVSSVSNCAEYSDKYLEYLILHDAHSPAKFRVNGPLLNIPQFGTDFNCPVGTKMNPAAKCSNVWTP